MCSVIWFRRYKTRTECPVVDLNWSMLSWSMLMIFLLFQRKDNRETILRDCLHSAAIASYQPVIVMRTACFIWCLFLIHSFCYSYKWNINKKNCIQIGLYKKKTVFMSIFHILVAFGMPIRLASIYRDPFRMHDNGEFDKKKSKQLASWGIRIVLSFVCEWFCGFYSEKCKVCQRWNH